jgi:hypothetical protein
MQNEKRIGIEKIESAYNEAKRNYDNANAEHSKVFAEFVKNPSETKKNSIILPIYNLFQFIPIYNYIKK